MQAICSNISKAHAGLYHPRGHGSIETEDDKGDEADSLLAAYRLGNEQLVYLLSKTYNMASVRTFYRNQEKVPSFLTCSGELDARSMFKNLESFVFSRPVVGGKCAWVGMVDASCRQRITQIVWTFLTYNMVIRHSSEHMLIPVETLLPGGCERRIRIEEVTLKIGRAQFQY